MNQEHENYINRFNEVGKPYLESYGFLVSEPEFKQSGQQLSFEIEKEHCPNYRFSFATNHLDYNLGVLVEEVVDDPWNKYVLRLPRNISSKKQTGYVYSGNAVDENINRLVRDFTNYIWKKQSLGGEPFDYCYQSVSDQTCSCGEENLSFITEQRLISGQYDYYYFCKDCLGYWKKSVFESAAVWLKVGELVDYLYEDPNYPIDFSERKYFPLTFFMVQEAIDLGLPLSCGRLNKIDSYYGLSCAVSNLELIHEYLFDDYGAGYMKKRVFRCKECGTLYNMDEEYDSHHGTHRSCKKITLEESESLRVMQETKTETKEQLIIPEEKVSWWKRVFK